MLKIRPEQMEVFQPTADAAFIRELIDDLRQDESIVVGLPTGVFSIGQILDETLYEMISNGIARARAYGMTWKYSLAAFITLLFETSPNFDEHPLIKRVLTDGNIPSDMRIDELLERASDDNWEAVKQNYDATAWRLSAKANE